MVKFDFKSYMKPISNHYDFSNIKSKLEHDSFTDWYHIDKCIKEEELEEIILTANHIRKNCDIFIVIGIGGSYLGAASVIEALRPYFKNDLPEILFAGTSLSSTYIKELVDYIKNKEVILNVISKSGTTLEPNLIFELLYDELQKRYNEDELQKKIIITTDEKEGYLRELVNKKSYQSFVVPSNIGGRYSVLTTVGLLPIAVSGIDIKMLLEGARSCVKDDAFHYAYIRNHLYHSGKIVESFTVYEQKLGLFTEWLKQLFGETEGKNNKGILPISCINTRDLHSLGQYFQNGKQVIFETVINIETMQNVFIKKYNKQLDEINRIALYSVAKAHYENETYSNIITIDRLNEFNLGYLIYFFELGAAVSGYLLDINPFDQPGVNAYKDNMKEELGEDND